MQHAEASARDQLDRRKVGAQLLVRRPLELRGLDGRVSRADALRGDTMESARPASRDVPVFRSLGGRGHFDSGGEEDGFSGDDARTFARRRRRLLGDFDRGLNLHHVS